MTFFELSPTDISALSDSDLRELVARLVEAELVQQAIPTSCVTWGGAQEAPDGGLDVRVENAVGISSSSFIPREHTGFQVKKNSMGRAACRKEMELAGKPKPIIEELAEMGGAYIIVSGKDNCTDKMRAERVSGMKEAAAGLSNKSSLYLDFYGIDRLSGWLRRHPSVALWARSRLGKPLSGWRPFGRWAATPIEQSDEFLANEHPCVIDANSNSKEPIPLLEGIQLTRGRLQKAGSTVRITGLSGVGKTRFAQALFEAEVGVDHLPASEVIYADLGEDLVPTASELIAYLVANELATYVVLDNCPPDVHRSLQKQVAENRAKVHLLTVEYDISDDKPEETQVIHLEPTSEKTVSSLIQRRFSKLDRINSDRIAEFSGGNARVALALASRVDADETLSNFSDEMLFRRIFVQRKDASDALLRSAETLALVYSFNVLRDGDDDELGVLATISGSDRHTLHRDHGKLLSRHLVQKRGHWRAVLPHALANRLAKYALENIATEDINAQLWKPGNWRLFQSCAHRLGYLHDHPQARELAVTWFGNGAPLSDIAGCSDRLLVVLRYVSPVLPEFVLSAIERASVDKDFSSRENGRFVHFVRLLCHFAYDDSTFDRAVDVLLKFAETEKAGENNNSIVGSMATLFSLHLSGTEATPDRRQKFVKRLLDSGELRHREIAERLLNAAFEAYRWTSFGTFHFGARKRGAGWSPETEAERLAWYHGFIDVLEPFLVGRSNKSEWARSILASHFRGLWWGAGCFDALERIVRAHGGEGQWPKIWIAIRRTIHYTREGYPPELVERLKSLEQLSAPRDLNSEVEAFVLSDVWSHVYPDGEEYEDRAALHRKKVIDLGAQAAHSLDCLQNLGEKLWRGVGQSLLWFGEGLAAESVDKFVMFDILVESFRNHKSESASIALLEGYVWGVFQIDAELSSKVLAHAMEKLELGPYRVALLTAIPISPWAVSKLLQLAGEGDLEAWRFEQLSYGRRHEALSDGDLSQLLSLLINLKNGFVSALAILSMRFHESKKRKYVPSQELRSVGRRVLVQLVSAHRDDVRVNSLHSLDRVVAEVLDETAPPEEVRSIMELFCNGVETYRLYGFEMSEFLSAMIVTHPEIVLETVFNGREDASHLAYSIFRERVGLRGPSLNDVPVERILAWCGDDQLRIAHVAAALHCYVAAVSTESGEEHPKRVVLSDHITSLLAVAKEREEIIEILFDSVHPGSWSGSLASILESRSEALAALLDYPDLKVRELVKTKINELRQWVLRQREREATEYNDREQRFE